jgi:hypothetical protein
MLFNTRIVIAMMQVNFRSNLSPISIAEPENGLPGGL